MWSAKWESVNQMNRTHFFNIFSFSILRYEIDKDQISYSIFFLRKERKKKWSGVVLKGEYEEDEIIELNDGGGGIRMNEYNN